MNSAQRLREASQQRRDHEKQELHKLILNAAAELFLEQGQESFSLRRVAERIGYSPATIYYYFENKDDLLLQVIDEGYLRFKNAFIEAANSVQDPIEKLLAMARSYVAFGLENPVYYQVIFMRRSDFLTRPRQGERQPRSVTLEILQKTVKEAMDAGLLEPGDPADYAHTFWALLHGLVALSITMPLFEEGWEKGVMEIFEKAIVEKMRSRQNGRGRLI